VAVLVLLPRVAGHQRAVVMVVVMVVAIVRIAVPERVLGLVQPWCGQKVQRVTTQQEVTA
jgi:hypothetical protein